MLRSLSLRFDTNWLKMIKLLALALILICCTIAAGCESATRLIEPAADNTFTLGGVALDSPAKLASGVFMPVAQQTPTGRLLFGAYARQQFGGQGLTTADQFLHFTPMWDPDIPGYNCAAFACLCFNMNGYTGEPKITLVWNGATPPPGDLWLGLSDFANDHWDWFEAPEEGPFTVPSLEPYINTSGQLIFSIVVLGTTIYCLDHVLIGERWMVEGVDLTQVFAPPLTYEIEVVKDDWARRNPVASGYTLIGEEPAGDGLTRHIISHEVDGYTHYATVRLPEAGAALPAPVVLLLHPGTDVSSDYDTELTNFNTDEELNRQCVVVTPSFRGGRLITEHYGTLRSEGPFSVYDRDADDTIALLSVVLEEYSEYAEQTHVMAVGYDNGAQVAQHLVERDPRLRGAVVIAGWVDDWAYPAQEQMVGALAAVSLSKPDPLGTYGFFYWDLRYGTRDIWVARQRMLRRSTPYFAKNIIKNRSDVQLHYGMADTVTPVEQAYRLLDAFNEIPDADCNINTYPGGTHNLVHMEAMKPLIRQIMRKWLLHLS